MKHIPFHQSWLFTYGDHEWLDSPTPQLVDLPHDFIISRPRTADAAGTGSNGYFGEGRGEYVKRFTRTDDMRGTVILLIDGAYMNCEVFLNGRQLANHPYGYTAFQVDLAPALIDGENELKLITQSRQPSTRWYSGGGVYRDVSLLVGGDQCLNPWDVFVTAEVQGGSAHIKVAAPGDIHTEILCGGELVAEGTSDLLLENPSLWSVDSPNLYTARVALMDGGSILDTYEVPFGVRTVQIDAKQGFRLNGVPMKLRGGCIHHDNGPLGACAFPDAEARKVRMMKQMGYNAIRSSHYPPSKALLDACDALGMLVMDEAFDVWTIGKKSLDYHLYFRDWWERDIESMVLRDRNHPCVFAWSIGNEIEERDSRKGAQEWAHILAKKVRSLDPTRPVASALNNIFSGPMTDFFSFDNKVNPIEAQNFDDDQFAARTEYFCEALDIVGYNYLLPRYAHDREKFPDRVIMGTETFAVNTYDYWQATVENPNVCGDFIWTAWDYLGEAGIGRTIWEDQPKQGFSGPFPWALSYDADFDITGGRRPQGYFREILWGLAKGPALMTMHPDRHGVRSRGMGWEFQDVAPIWNYEDKWLGKPVDVFAYADADEVEFILNGMSVATSKVEKLMASAVVPYAPGVLECVARKAGAEIGRRAIETCGAPASIRLTPDVDSLRPNALDLCHVQVEILDEAGRVVPHQDVTLMATVSGAGTLQTLGNADPFSQQVYGTGIRDTYRGRALAIVRAAGEPGEATLTVAAAGLAPQSVREIVRAG